jgi:sulfonate transport system substrate-binding protein
MRSAMMRFVVSLAATSLLLIGGCESERAAVPPEKVTIACATPPYTTLVDIAFAKGFFRKEGLEATPHFHSTGKAALDEVLAGTADFATVAETPVMFAVMNGSKISIIATIQDSNKAVAILARRDKGISAPQDLKEKRIAASLGTIGEYFLDAFLATHGATRGDIKLVNLEAEQITDALTGSEIDAASLFVPFLNQAQQKLGDNGITFYEEDIYTQTFNLVTTREQILSNPARVRKLLMALIEAEKLATRDPAEAQKSITDFRQMDKVVLAAEWGSHSFGVSLDQALLLALEDESQWAIKSGLTNAKKVPNYLEFIHLDGLQSVKPGAVRIVR